MYFSRDNKTYWYEVHGEGIPVVMLHGFTGSSKSWNAFIDEWGIGFQIITVDLPGHGKTSAPALNSMDECLQDLNKLFHSLELKTFHLMGYSMGGRTALSYTMLYPNQVNTLILESASPGLEDVEERKLRQKNDALLAGRIEQEGLQSFVDYWQDIPLFHSQKSLPVEIQEKLRSERMSQTTEGLAHSLRTMGTGSQDTLWSRLRTLDMPVLLLVGELDPKFVMINKKMQSKLKSGNLIICEDAGHAIHVEKPEIFGKIVIGFLNGTTEFD